MRGFRIALFLTLATTVLGGISNVRIVPTRNTYTPNERVNIYWDFSGIPSNAKVIITIWRALPNQTQNICRIDRDVNITVGRTGYPWTVTDTCINPHTGATEDLTTSSIKIRVRWQQHSDYAESRAFSVLPAPTIFNVRLQPSSSTYQENDRVMIYWDKNRTIPDNAQVRITIWREGGANNICRIAQDVPVTSGQSGFPWTVQATCTNPHSGATEDLTTSRIKIRVRWQGHQAYGETPLFTVRRRAPGASITVLSPNGGETLQEGDTFTIRWRSQNVSGNVKIALIVPTSSNVFLDAGTIASSAPNTGSFSWRVGEFERPGPAYGTTQQYKIRISSVDNPSVCDVSDSPFSIAARRTINLLGPQDGSQYYLYRDRITFSWNTTGNVGNYLFLHMAGPMTIFKTVVENTGRYVLDLRDSDLRPGTYSCWLTPTNTYSIKSSAVSITLKRPYLRVITPASGMSCTEGYNCYIRWESEGLEGVPIDIALMTVDGGFVTNIATATENDGVYIWRVHYAPNSLSRIKLSALRGKVEALSEPFLLKKYVKPEIKILIPNSRTEWYIGKVVKIKWEKKGATAPWVSIELLDEQGRVEKIIKRRTNNDEEESWFISRDTRVGQHKIRISTTDGRLQATSSLFTIRRPILRISSPSNGSRFSCSTSSIGISWHISGPMGKIAKITLSKLDSNGRVVRETLIAYTKNTGYYRWTIRHIEPGKYRLKVETNDGYSDTVIIYFFR